MLKTDSNRIEKGDTFLALRGVLKDGHDYIEEAIKKGAVRVICEYGSYEVDTLVVQDTRKYLADYLYGMYGEVIQRLKLIGITGTNGKTTSANLVYQILVGLGVKVAYIGTLGFYLGEDVIETNNTTPDLMELYEIFVRCVDSDVKVVVMEVSSHALEIGRLLNVNFDIVAFTNLTQDHLDVHGNMENYLQAKLKLFNKIKKGGLAIINSDDPLYDRFLLDENVNYTYGVSGDYRLIDYKLKMDRTFVRIGYNGDTYEVNIKLSCKYNIYNYLLALAIVNKLGYRIEDIIGISVHASLGRFEIINYKDNVIVIDYAHTPDAVLNILKNCNDLKEGRIITLIGCGGRRDRSKRPIMGKIATDYSDYVIFTDDNPRTENHYDITNDIVNGLKCLNYEVINDRKSATIKAFSLLNNKDMLLLLGKGHEEYQIIGDDRIHYSDRETVLELIDNCK